MKPNKLFSNFLLILIFAGCTFSLQAQSSKSSNKRNYKEIEKYALEDKNGIDTSGVNLFIGSSTFTLWKDMPSYFPGFKVLNRGFGGSKLTDVIYYADRLIYPYKPSQVVLYEGDNDLGLGIKVDDLLFDLKVFVRLMEIKLPDVPIVLVSVKYSPARNKQRMYIKEYNSKMEEFAKTKPFLKFVDIASITLNKDGSYRKDLFKSDSLHVNEKCYRMYAEKITLLLVKQK
jgi:hypothetical protein